MPPKRIAKQNIPKPVPQPATVDCNDQQSKDSIEAELKFDQEVLWCISQFEKLLNSGKLPDTKKQETIRAMSKLRKPDLPKIQKLQLMRQYFKDVKTKMQKDESESQKLEPSESFKTDVKTTKGVFVKKRIVNEKEQTSSTFLFNFKDSSENEMKDLHTKVDALRL